MYKNVLETIGGIDIYPVISLIIFFLFFAGVLIWVFKSDKKYMNQMGELPLETNTVSNNGLGGVK